MFLLVVKLRVACAGNVLLKSFASCQFAQTATLVTCILEVISLNLGLETEYSDCGSSCFSSVPLGKCEHLYFKLARDLRFTSFPITGGFTV